MQPTTKKHSLFKERVIYFESFDSKVINEQVYMAFGFNIVSS